MPPVIAWATASIFTLVVASICAYRFRLALRGTGVKVMDVWERAGSVTDPGAVIRDDFAVMSELLRRQPVPSVERWRLATIVAMVVFIGLVVAPVVLGQAT